MNYVALVVVSLLAVAFSRLTLVTVFERSMLTASSHRFCISCNRIYFIDRNDWYSEVRSIFQRN